jgi:hypothetical protein
MKILNIIKSFIGKPSTAVFEVLKNFIGNEIGGQFEYSLKKQIFLASSVIALGFPIIAWTRNPEHLKEILDFWTVIIPVLAASYTAGKAVDKYSK